MGEGDIQAIKEALGKVERGLGKLSDAVADLRVLVAGNYVAKADFLDYQKIEEARVVAIHNKIDDIDDKINGHQKEEWQDRLKVGALVLAISSFVFGIFQFISRSGAK